MAADASLRPAPPPGPVAAAASPPRQEEGLLRDVLDELDRERGQRAELEARLRALEQAQERQDRAAAAQLAVLRYEVEGYRQTLSALSSARPALARAAHIAIPVHTLRLLEITPWDPRARDFIFQTDRLCEWQAYADGAWRGGLKHLPAPLRNLPVARPGAGSAAAGSPSAAALASPAAIMVQAMAAGYGAVQSSPRSDDDPRTMMDTLAAAAAAQGARRTRPGPLRAVLTDPAAARIYQDIDADYPLPYPAARGTWEWVGKWEPEEDATAGAAAGAPDDAHGGGWVYGSTVHGIAAAIKEALVSPAATAQPHPPAPPAPAPGLLRCRLWARRRALVEYPHAGAATRAYLRELTDHARLRAACRHLSDRLARANQALDAARDERDAAWAQLAEAQRRLEKLPPATTAARAGAGLPRGGEEETIEFSGT